MVMAKARTMLFEQWWRECVVRDDAAQTPHREMYRHYRRWGHCTGMGEQAFTARLNEMSIGQRKERGVRYRLGVRLLPPPEEGDGEARVAAPPAAIPPAVPLYRLTPYNPGEAETLNAVMLEVHGDDDTASAAIARELYGERRRQRMPVADGGEGRSAEHDDREYGAGELERAAATYAFAAAQRDELAPYIELNRKEARLPSHVGTLIRDFVVYAWPWHSQWWKPKTETPDWKRRCMVKAGALLIAAIEAHDRRTARARLSAEEQHQATGV